MNSFVLCHIPRAGLGNQLLTWAKAEAFGLLHGLEVLHWGWSMPSKTRVQRIMQGNETWISLMRPSPWPYIIKRMIQAKGCPRVIEPPRSLIPERQGKVYVFNCVPPWQDYFEDFREHRPQVLERLPAILRPGVQKQADELQPPFVVANVRMGDFRKLHEGVDFASVGQHRTPFGFFESTVAGIRHYAGWNVPVHLVSDGTAEELAPLLAAVSDVSLVPQRPAIINLLWMSKARAILCSAGSTFSLWAGFLGEASMLHHPAHTPPPTRDAALSARCYDGAAVQDWTQWPELLRLNLQAIRPEAAVEINRKSAVWRP